MATPAEDKFSPPQIEGNLNSLILENLNQSIPRELTKHEQIPANPTARQCASILALPQGLVLSATNINQINIT